MSQRRALGITAASVLVLGLAACEGGSEEPSPSATTVATSSAAPTEPETTSAEPTQPDVAAPDPADYPGMDQQTEDGAKQAFRYFFAALIYGYQTGDAKPLESVSAPECEYCQKASEDLRALADENRVWEATEVTDRHLSVEQEIPQGFVIGYGYEVSAHVEPGASGGAGTTEPAALYGAAGELHWVGDSWRVSYVENKK